MRGINKKMLISIFTSVIVLITIVATTFAWVGIFTYANTEDFSFNLKVSELDANYFLTISATGEKGTFSDEADTTEIKKQILMNINNWSKEFVDEKKADEIDALYSRYCITTPSSCTLTSEGNLSKFYSINNKNTNYYETYKPTNAVIKFDLYLSVDTKEGIKYDQETGLAPEDVRINSNVLITDLENTIIGTLCEQKLTNLNPYKEMELPSTYSALKQLPNSEFFGMNSANSTRFALCMYDPIDIRDTYNGHETPAKTLIYHGGEQLPTELDGDIFDLGGILPEEYNVALREMLIVRPNYKNSVYTTANQQFYEDLDKAILRGQTDLDLVEENSKIWDKPSDGELHNKAYLGVYNGIQTKQKISVYFWFEGWDSDCVIGINEKPVTLNLTFTAGISD